MNVQVSAATILAAQIANRYMYLSIGQTASPESEHQAVDPVAEPGVPPDLDPVLYIGKSKSNNEKVALLTKKWTPPLGFKYPAVNGRRYNTHWESDYCWLRYSRSKDAVFCAYCIVFGSNMHGSGSSSMEVFQTSGFRDWKNAIGNKRGAFLCHQNSDMHREAAIRALSYKSVTAGSTRSICSHLSDTYAKNLQERREG